VAPVKDWPIMHFTHVNNLEGIMTSRGLHPDCVVRQEGVVRECGDQSIKERRRATPVKVPPGGVVGDYVPFYFAPRSPMLYVIHRGRVPTYQEGQDPLIYLVSSLTVIANSDVRWVGSDGNTAAAVSQHTDDWATLESMIDWPLMRAKQWNNTDDDGDRMRRRMAELLVHRFFPIDCVQYAVARTKHATEAANERFGGTLQVRTWPSWYF
jgi:hypothetical protein